MSDRYPYGADTLIIPFTIVPTPGPPPADDSSPSNPPAPEPDDAAEP